MLEDIRRYIMKRFVEKKKFTLRWKGNYGKIILDKLAAEGRVTSVWKCTYTGDNSYKVKSRSDIYPVNLKNRTCSGGKWDLSSIPCKHAIVCIEELGENIKDYLNEWYHKQQYIKTYQYSLHPISRPNI